MSKKKGRGRDINKSLEVMGELIKLLERFNSMPLKQGLKSENIDDKDLLKKVNDTLEKGFTFSMSVEDLRNMIHGSKAPSGNARFASQRVVSKFLESL